MRILFFKGGLLAGLLMVAPAQAQVTASLEFVGAFGQFGFYTSSFPPNSLPPTGFNNPSGVAFLSADRLLIADYGNNKLQTCDLAGEDCRWIGGDGGFRNMPGTFDRPHGVAVRDDGRFAVADEDNHAVQLCTLSGNCTYRGDSVTMDNKPNAGLGRWAFPDDVAFDSQGRVFGLDTGNDRVQILRADNLNVADAFMSSGQAPGQIDGARGIAVDGEDRVIVADTGNDRIQVCDTNANCTTFGSRGSAPGRFNTPIGVDVDHLGRIWVVDSGNRRVQVCSYEGDCVAFGANRGFDFVEPNDIAVHPSGLVAVTDPGRDNVQLFATEAETFTVNAGLNDAWYERATSGQGFFVTVYPERQQVFMANFTFDTERPPQDVTAVLGEPGHRWLTGLGDIAGATATLDVTLTEGGLFDAEQPRPTNTTGYGTWEVEFLGCDHIRLTYDLPAIPRTGVIELERVVKDNLPLCEALSSN